MFVNNQADEMGFEIKAMFPDAPKTPEDQAKLHMIIFKYDNDVRHLVGNGFISVIYPANGEYPASVEVYESPGECIYASKM